MVRTPERPLDPAAHQTAQTNCSRPAKGKTGSQRGFSLLELIIVIAIIGILAAITAPNFRYVPQRAKEAVLKTNLRTIRDAIDQHYADKGSYPDSLSALVGAGYLRSIPLDPMTKSSETWVEVRAEFDEDATETDFEDEFEPGVEDVRSGAEILSLKGESLYSEW